MAQTLIDLTGQTFGRLTVLSLAPKAYRHYCWHCRCTCGTETTVRGDHLKAGRTVSCGCLKREQTHGHARHRTTGKKRSPEYLAWSNMKARCYNPKNPQYDDYGGRGIKVCWAWQVSFEAFLEHIGPRPDPKLTLERIDNEGNYAPGNVCWATRKVQNNNQRPRRNSKKQTVPAELGHYRVT